MIYLLLAGLCLSRVRSAPIELLVDSLVVRDEIGTIPSDRTLSTLMLTCLSTTLACTWISVHPNLPHNQRRFTSPLLRLLLSFYSLIAPEAILFWAVVQWNAARQYEKEFEDKGWTITHGFFLVMGGFTIPYEEDKTTKKILLRSLPPREFKYLARKGYIEFPNVSEADILDRSKGDPLAKGFVVLQTLGFSIQILARYIQRLVITELELITLALVPLNIATYCFWMHKPLSVRRAIPLRWTGGTLPSPDDMKDYVTESGKATADDYKKMREGGQAVDEKSCVLHEEHRITSSEPAVSKDTVVEDAQTISAGLVPDARRATTDSAASNITETHISLVPSPNTPIRPLSPSKPETNAVSTPSTDDDDFDRFVAKIKHIMHFWESEPDENDPNPVNRTKPPKPQPAKESAPSVSGDSTMSTLHEIESMTRRVAIFCMWVIGIILIGVPLAAIAFAIGLGGVAIILGIILSAMLVTIVYGVLKRLLTIPRKGVQAFSAIGGEEPDTLNGPRKKFPTLYAPAQDDINYHLTLTLAVIGATVFGGLHVLGWNFTFPSRAERILWRTSSIALATIPLSSFLIFHVGNFFSVWDEGAGLKWIRRPIMYLYMCVLILSTYVYPVARVYVLVESVIALRHPTPGTFTPVVWSKFIPDI